MLKIHLQILRKKTFKLFNTIVVVAIVAGFVVAIVVVVSVSVLGFAFGFYAYCNRQFGAIHS